MNDGAEFTIDGEGPDRRIALSGNYLVSTIGPIDTQLRAVEGPLTQIDLSQVREIDTVGAWIALGLAGQLKDALAPHHILSDGRILLSHDSGAGAG